MAADTLRAYNMRNAVLAKPYGLMPAIGTRHEATAAANALFMIYDWQHPRPAVKLGRRHERRQLLAYKLL